eukprot:Em0019g812a
MKAIAAFLLILMVGNSVALSNHAIVKGSGKAVESKPGLDLCPTCIGFANDFINDLLNIILNGGVVGGCSDLCQLLEEKTGSQLADVVCNLLCDYVGIEEFIKIIQESDLDPIYYCELLHACPINDNGDATIVSVQVVPPTFHKGAKFAIETLFTSQAGTGTGEIDIQVITVDGFPYGYDDLVQAVSPGAYNITISDQATPSGCDQGPCEEWLPGNYTVVVTLCDGECFSKHPHSQIYSTMNATFVVEKKGF